MCQYSTVLTGLLCLVMTIGAAAQQDCNLNGTPDADDITSGLSADCNNNGIPDECDISSTLLTPGTPIPATGLPVSLISADLTGDGNPELIYVNVTNNSVDVLINDGQGGFGFQSILAGVQPAAVVAFDADGDGDLDLATANFGADNVSILINQTPPGAGSLVFDPAVGVETGDMPMSILAVDLDNDGDQDLVVANYLSNTVSRLINTFGVFAPDTTGQAVGLQPIALASGDFDNDGLPDVAVANFFSNNLSILLSSGTPVDPTLATFGEPLALAAGDFNNDGSDDLAVVNASLDNILILLNTGNGSLQEHVALTGLAGISSVKAVSVLGSGNVDLLAADEDEILIFAGAGNGNFLLARRASVPAGVNGVEAGNFTSSSLQVAALNESAQNITIFTAAEGIETDCNANNIPDSCEADSDGDGVIDDCQDGGSPGPGPAPGCGAGAGASCGAGGAGLLPAGLIGLGSLKRTARRRRRV